MVTESEVRSPCVSICVLNPDDVCVGCYRTGEEITEWFMVDDSKKREILALANERRVKDGGVL